MNNWRKLSKSEEKRIRTQMQNVKDKDIRMASTTKLRIVARMAKDFMENCVCERADYLITDYSYLSDFDVRKREVLSKAKSRYKVDIAPVFNKPIVDIANFILREITNED